MIFANMIEAVIQPRLGTAAGVSPRKFSYPDWPTSLHPQEAGAFVVSGGNLFRGRRVASDGGPTHIAHFGFVEAAHPMHGLAVVPHHQVELPPSVDIDILRPR